MTDNIIQIPEPGASVVKFCGDVIKFTLKTKTEHYNKGSAFVRTNLGHGDITRQEIIGEVLYDESPLNRDWFDIPMKDKGQGIYEITLPLCEPGHFQAKTYFLEKGKEHLIWPKGPNTFINVEPAGSCCANIIYNAFVRQFGPYKSGSKTDPDMEKCITLLDKKGFTVIPGSGTFRDLIKELDFIFEDLGCRYLQLLPVHPTPTTYGRMGRFGSPYAALSFTDVDPALAEFDPRATPLDQFIELVDSVHARMGKIIMDIAINHTGWAANLHETHPEWLSRDEEGKIQMPGAWDVIWADLTKLDYSHKDLWEYMAKVFLTWCRRGVDGFRLDAGYMIPEKAWKFIVARVRDEFPDTVFFLEGLGGKISVTRALLSRANLNWAYSELFQNYDRNQVENYLPRVIEISEKHGLLIHFAETHDNNRLASESKIYAKMRTALCALSSHSGGFAFANGVEWFATEKIDVHGSPSLNWGSTENQVGHISGLNKLLKFHPCFYDNVEIKMIQTGEGQGIALLRHHRPSGKKLLILVNLDHKNQTLLSWSASEIKINSPIDLLSGNNLKFDEKHGIFTAIMEPGQVFCLSADHSDMIFFQKNHNDYPERLKNQHFRTKSLDIFRYYNGIKDLGNFDPDIGAKELWGNPLFFCRNMNPYSDESRVIIWSWPEDVKREVMIPYGFFFMIKAEKSFRAVIMDGDFTVCKEEALQSSDGTWFALFVPNFFPKSHKKVLLKISVFDSGKCHHVEAPLLFLSSHENFVGRRFFTGKKVRKIPFLFLGTNGRGAMLRAHAAWSKLESRYDALLGANLNKEYPEDRWIMFTRCRAWVVYQDYSYELGTKCLQSFYVDENFTGYWKYTIPTGLGEEIFLTIAMKMIWGKNAVEICFFRGKSNSSAGKLPDDKPVKLILRPDIEDRNFHDVTKAYMGPENHFPASIKEIENGFVFAPHKDRRLFMTISSGEFIKEPEWYYMVKRDLEAQRGLDPDSDLFSPGYFKAYIKGNEKVALLAYIKDENTPGFMKPQCFSFRPPLKKGARIIPALKAAMNQFIVKRDQYKTVIAGYPWFLDWGRDTLIFVRGLIAAQKIKESVNILKQFAMFEQNGTLPNMIRGNDAGNRDTSDAPLWFFTAWYDLYEKNNGVSDEICNGKCLKDILISMGRSLINGTPNGIYMDEESGLIFSPSHFTWMDTNHPAGTPREGYPVEIQALWHRALSFLSKIDRKNSSYWHEIKTKVENSIIKLFFMENKGYLADCLYAKPGIGAKDAIKDDSLRPNQLFAITLDVIKRPDISGKILDACQFLLIPGAIRSLADRKFDFALEIRHNGTTLNDPHHPYKGRYEGDEDTMRKPAYHNGTAWMWIFPSFCEAWVKRYGKNARESALSWLSSSSPVLNSGCIGHMPEIADGDYPHKKRGCDAQAWSVSELFRVLIYLKN